MKDSFWSIRLVLGLSALAALALVDLYKNPKNPRRVKEYGFLFAVTGLTMVYGLLVDTVTYSVSREYFFVGKGLESARAGFFPDVALMAL